MSFILSLIMSVALGFNPTPPTVYESTECPPYTQGYVKDNKLIVCPNQLTMPREEVIKHETVHLIQSNLGVDTLLPRSVLDYLVHETLSEAETLSVLIHYSDSGYMYPEFEARVLQTLPTSVIMTLYWVSEHATYPG